MDFTYDDNTFSDLYKDAHGFRPRGHEFYDANTTPARKQEIWDATLRDLDQTIEWEKQAEAQAIVEFEKLVDKTIEAGAGDRETALKWIAQSEGEEFYGTGYFRYLFGLPYGYVLEQEAA
jgi:hypothetical protein